MLKSNTGVVQHISNLAGDYKCWDKKLSHSEVLELNAMLEELETLRKYAKDWHMLTNYFKDSKGHLLKLGDEVTFKVNVTNWGRHLNGIDPENLENSGDDIYATMTGKINFDPDENQFCVDTDYYYLPSIYISCIEEGSLELHIGQDLDKNSTNLEEPASPSEQSEEELEHPSECNEEELELE